MSVSGVNGIGVAAYAYTNSSKKTVEESNFASEVQKAGESQNTTDCLCMGGGYGYSVSAKL